MEFVGPLGHEELAKLLPAADVAVVPSIFPESFGLVAAEAAASGVPPFVADHSGLREAGGLVGRGLPFDLRVSTDGFEENLADALADYLSLPAERSGPATPEVVRNNSVEYLGWDTLAEKIVRLAGRLKSFLLGGFFGIFGFVEVVAGLVHGVGGAHFTPAVEVGLPDNVGGDRRGHKEEEGDHDDPQYDALIRGEH